jgi:uncharacterized protein YkwD
VLRLNHVFALLAVGFALFAAVPTAFAARSSSGEDSLLRAVNATRTSHGLRPVGLDARLRAAARSHSLEMLRGNYFAHGDFGSRMLAFHVLGSFAGENLAWGTGSYAAARTIVNEWLASPEHRANLLRPGFTRIGIGLARGSFLGNGGATVVTADFAG